MLRKPFRSKVSEPSLLMNVTSLSGGGGGSFGGGLAAGGGGSSFPFSSVMLEVTTEWVSMNVCLSGQAVVRDSTPTSWPRPSWRGPQAHPSPIRRIPQRLSWVAGAASRVVEQEPNHYPPKN